MNIEFNDLQGLLLNVLITEYLKRLLTDLFANTYLFEMIAILHDVYQNKETPSSSPE